LQAASLQYYGNAQENLMDTNYGQTQDSQFAWHPSCSSSSVQMKNLLLH